MMTETARVGPKAVHSLWMRFQVLQVQRGEKEHFWLTMKMRRILVNEHMERLYMMLGHAHS
jgi:hypothetical protein